jgi:hypothetical protein
MKKLLTAIALCSAFMLAVSPINADAQIVMCGEGFVEAIVLLDSNAADIPNGDCYVSIENFAVDTVNDAPVVPPRTIPLITARAFGTGINLALLKEQNMDPPKLVGLCMEFVPFSTYWRIISFECIGQWHTPDNTI